MLHRPGVDDADHAALLHAARLTARHRSDLVRRAVPDLHAARAAHPAIRPAAVYDEGRRAPAHHNERRLLVGDALRRLWPAGDGAGILLAPIGNLAAAAAWNLN